jgi:hypothetical protein
LETEFERRHADIEGFMGALQPDPATRREQQRIAAELSTIDFVLPGTVVERMMPCGKRRCRCKNDPPQLHGPYLQWTRKVNGKTVTRTLTPEQFARYQGWLANARHLRELTTELETLTLQAVQQAEGWGS